ncbi:MAG TPA: Spy/CpxP family protein refolding chaperone [Methylomirabilota bacterium]|jgi:hypothetical protein|nr:Spy/CpxP family protein refolding chaperone [Methylomirabilota bacterium]
MTRIAITLVLVATLLGLGGLALADSVRPAFHEDAGRALGEVVEQFRSLGSQLERHLSGPGSRPYGEPPMSYPAERPVISFMLEHRSELGLTPEQQSRLEALRGEFTREQIRREAEIRIAEMDLAALLEQDLLDMGKVEAKIREAAKLRSDLRIERLKTLEQGKALLTPEQRGRLRSMLGPAGGPRRTADRPTRL